MIACSWIAVTAFGDGPNGFSLLASFMTSSVMPSSRTTSDIGFPGLYGLMVFARETGVVSPEALADVVRASDIGDRVPSEVLEEV